jgi:hypothetical protein
MIEGGWAFNMKIMDRRVDPRIYYNDMDVIAVLPGIQF